MDEVSIICREFCGAHLSLRIGGSGPRAALREAYVIAGLLCSFNPARDLTSLPTEGLVIAHQTMDRKTRASRETDPGTLIILARHIASRVFTRDNHDLATFSGLLCLQKNPFACAVLFTLCCFQAPEDTLKQAAVSLKIHLRRLNLPKVREAAATISAALDVHKIAQRWLD